MAEKSMMPRDPFLAPRSRHRDVQTSQDAAKVASRLSGIQSNMIREVMNACPFPLAVEQIAARTGLEKGAVARRVCDLVKTNELEASGQQHVNENGCKANRWRVRVPDEQ